MIFLRGPEEQTWWREHCQKQQPIWNRFFERRNSDRRPDTQVIFGDRRRDVVALFGAAQRNRCGACGARLVDGLYLDHLRPAHNAAVKTGEYHPRHYYWLAFEWSNLLGLCGACAHSKANRWPIAGRVAQVGETGEALLAEQALMIDPRRDDPREHLEHWPDGSVRPRNSSIQGLATIDLFNLNRPSLCESRRLIWRDVTRLCETAQRFETAEARIATEELGDQFMPYRAAAIDAIDAFNRSTAGPPIKLSFDLSPRPLESSPGRPRPPVVTTPGPGVSDGPPAETHDFVAAPRYIRRIEIEGFKSVAGVEIDFREEEPSLSPRREEYRRLMGKSDASLGLPAMALLGENASGKTSILQACALALSPKALNIQSDKLLPPRVDKSRVVIHLNDGTRCRMTLVRGRKPRRDGRPKGIPVFAFGAMPPTVPRKGKKPALGESRIDELFAEIAQTRRVDEWLSELPEAQSSEQPGDDASRTDDIKQAIREIIERGDEVTFEHDGPKQPFWFRIDGKKLVLSELSAGYRWLVGIAAELMATFYESRVDLVNGNAIVFIDEFGANLHPRWKMVAMRRLRQTFPRVQFVVSTHDPLCLRGFHRDEVTLLQRDEDGVIFETQDLPSPDGLTAEQLLCSDFFGLSSSMDEDLEAMFREYRGLAAVQSRSEEQERRYVDLRETLRGVGQLGRSTREQMMLEVIDAFLARRALIRGEHPTADEELREDTYRRLWKIVGLPDTPEVPRGRL